MFTGIIQELGKVTSLKRFSDRMELTVACSFAADLKEGDSVCVNGVCLTVSQKMRDSFKADVVKETMEKSALIYVKVGDKVNLERAIASSGRFDGHIVQGHVDSKAMIINIINSGAIRELEIRIPEGFSKYVTSKGSIAVDGVSLTIASAVRGSFRVAVIPATALRTNLLHKKIGEWVGLEFDVLAKYVETLIREKKVPDLNMMKEMRIDEGFLKKAGLFN